jgi:hypothetical protein
MEQRLRTTFEGITQKYFTERQVEKLRKLFDFSFKQHPKYNYSTKIFSNIENNIQSRASELINLAKSKPEKRHRM